MEPAHAVVQHRHDDHGDGRGLGGCLERGKERPAVQPRELDIEHDGVRLLPANSR
jgi:hypothetical protein